jgi:2,3-bisphosphoglycerate-dependent phosphoglycerate mutase
LRETNYGDMNGTPVAGFEGRRREFVDTPYPGGESWRDAVVRLQDFLEWLGREHDGKRVVVIGHGAQRFGFMHLREGQRLEDLVDADFGWQEGWEYSYG